MTTEEIEKKTKELLNDDFLKGDPTDQILYSSAIDVMKGLEECIPGPFDLISDHALKLTKHFLKLNCFLLTQQTIKGEIT